jgi:Flp pilus assembly protein TadG
MTAHRTVSAARRRRSGGNALIESAFTLLPTFALIFAFLDFGMMLYRWSTLQNAVREGVRYAITFQTLSGMGQTASIRRKVEEYSMGLVRTTDIPNRIFVKYYTTSNTNTPIPSGGNVPGNIVEVSVEGIPFSWMVPLSGSYGAGIPFFRADNPLTLNVYASDILGGYPVGVTGVPE